LLLIILFTLNRVAGLIHTFTSMSVADRFKIWKFEKNRLEAFSDGVFAIIITLLVLEIKIPQLGEHADSAGLWQALKDIFPVLFSWVISFMIVGTLWLQHHNILSMARKADYAMVWLNTLFLLFTSLIPFPLHLMGEYPTVPLAVASLGIVLLFVSVFLIAIYYYSVKNYLSESYDKAEVMKNVRKSVIAGPLFYLIAIGSAWVSTAITFSIYGIVPVLFILPLDKPKK
jgi:uncharacterized membrane protein